jgi:small subunit ribosomal protein S21
LRRNNNRNNHEKAGLRVEVRNGDFNFALRKFKKKVQEDGILQELRERQHFTKPSEKRKKAKAAGRARWLKKMRKREQDFGY